MADQPPRILIDTSILIQSLDLMGIDQGLQVLWWGCEWAIVSKQLQWLPKRPRADEPFKEKQLSYLPVLFRLVGAGELSAAVSDAILREREIGAKGINSSLFGLELTELPVLPTGLDLPEPLVHRAFEQRRAFSLEEARSLDQRVSDLIDILGAKHFADCVHIFTAEKHGLTAFVTTDGRFVRQFNNHRQKHQSPIEAITPGDLLARLNIPPAGAAEIWKIHDYFSQQRLIPMCQFRWPKSWLRRFILHVRGEIELQPLQGRLEVPDRQELVARLIDEELKILMRKRRS